MEASSLFIILDRKVPKNYSYLQLYQPASVYRISFNCIGLNKANLLKERDTFGFRANLR